MQPGGVLPIRSEGLGGRTARELENLPEVGGKGGAQRLHFKCEAEKPAQIYDKILGIKAFLKRKCL